MTISPGTALKLIVYEVDGNRYARGFSFNLQQELDIELNPTLPKIYPPSIVSFHVSDTNHLGLLVPQKDSLVTAEDEEICRVKGNQIELDAHILFSSRTKGRNEVYSPEYGWVACSDRLFGCYCLNLLYKAYIKRDYSPKLKERGLLFSICSADDMRVVEDTKKLSNYFQQLKEAEDKRYTPVPMPPQPQPIKSVPEKDLWDPPTNKQPPPTPAPVRNYEYEKEMYEKKMKSRADGVSLFLILNLNNKGRQDKGVAWAMRMRALGLHTTFVNGQSEMLQEGCWYEGVCKWNRKFTKTHGGYYVEKVYKQTQFAPIPTRCVPRGNKTYIEITLEVNFTDDLYPEQPRAKDKIILKNFQINAVEMTKAMHRQYYGKKCMCLLFNKPFNNNSEITDWEVVSVAQVKGPADQEEACWSSSQAPTDMPCDDKAEDEEEEPLPEGEDDGAPPDDDDDYHRDTRPQKPPSKFTNVPSRDAQQPRAVYPEAGRHSADRGQHNDYNERAYSERASSNYDQRNGKDYMGYEVEGGSTYIQEALVVMGHQGDAVVYANEAREGILVKNMRLSQGSFISLEVLKLAIPQNGGLHYIARNETIRPVRSPPQIRVFAIGGALFVDTNCPMEFTKPMEGGYRLYSNDLGYLYSPDTLEHEEGGTISLSDMRNGTGGKNWRIWVQFTHHEQPNGQGGFRWEAMKVRGPQLQVDQYENEDFARIFDEIDIDKQCNHFAEFGIGESARPNPDHWDNRNGRGEGRSTGNERGYPREDDRIRGNEGHYPREDERSSRGDGREDAWRDTRDDVRSTRDNGGYARGEGRNSREEAHYGRDDRNSTRDDGGYSRSGARSDYTRSPTRASSTYTASAPPPPKTTVNQSDNTMPDDLFEQIWSIADLRKCLKINDYELYCEAESTVEKMKEKRLRNRAANPQNDQYREWSGDNRSEYSRPVTEMRGQAADGRYKNDNLRRAFHGCSSSSYSQASRGGYEDCDQYGRRYD